MLTAYDQHFKEHFIKNATGCEPPVKKEVMRQHPIRIG